jgi:hypothetical protein
MMSNFNEPARILPNPRIPKRIGFWNVVFASLLLLYGILQIALIVLAPKFTEIMEQQSKAIEATTKAETQANIAKLEAEVKSAQTKEEKELAEMQLESAKTALDSSSNTFTLNMNDLKVDDPVQNTYAGAELTSMLILNVLMFITGIGLLGLAEWARKVWIWTAAIKIVRLFAFAAFFLIVLSPRVERAAREVYEKAEAKIEAEIAKEKNDKTKAAKQSPASLASRRAMTQSMKNMTLVTSNLMKVSIPIFALLGSIYPAICIWFLTRPQSVAACRRGKPARPAAGDFA